MDNDACDSCTAGKVLSVFDDTMDVALARGVAVSAVASLHRVFRTVRF